MFYKPSTIPNTTALQSRSQKFSQGANNNQVSTFKYLMPLVFEVGKYKVYFKLN